MTMKKIISFTFLLFTGFHLSLWANDRICQLQQLIDAASATHVGNRVSGEPTVIDLTAEGVDGTVDETLYVRNGANVKFINGTLTCKCQPMIEIADNSQLILGNHVTMDLGYPIGTAPLQVNGGTLKVEEGCLIKFDDEYSALMPKKTTAANQKRIPMEPFYITNAVTLCKDGDFFYLQGGEIQGYVSSTKVDSYIIIESGRLAGILDSSSYFDDVTGKPTIEVSGGIIEQIGFRYSERFDAAIYLSGGYVDYISTCGSVRATDNAHANQVIRMKDNDVNAPGVTTDPFFQVYGGRIHRVQSDCNVEIAGDARLDSLTLAAADNYLLIGNMLAHDVCVGVSRLKGEVIAKGFSISPGKLYQLTSKDSEHVIAYTESQDLDNPIATMTMSNWWYFHCFPQKTTLKGNSIELRKKNLQELIDESKDNDSDKDVTSNDGFDVDEDFDVDDIQIFIDGSEQNPLPVVGFYGGSVKISANAGMSFKSVNFASMDTSSARQRASVCGGIVNNGSLAFENCTFREGSYTIENSGTASVGGGNTGCRLVNKAGGRIVVTSPLTADLTVVIPTEADVEQGVAIVTGVSGEEHILLSLPAGYAYKYDAAAGGIVIYSTSGITVLERQNTVVESYDVTGRKASQNGKGLRIQRMSDGTVMKTISND